jgi:hypothetical protein
VRPYEVGEEVIKYGVRIGHATEPQPPASPPPSSDA